MNIICTLTFSDVASFLFLTFSTIIYLLYTDYTKCTSIVLRFSLNQFIEILFILILIFPPCDFGSFHCYILKLPNLLFFGNHLSSLFFFSKHVKNSIHCAFISDRIFFKHSSSLLLKYVKYSFNKYFISLFTISIIHCGSYFFPNFNFHLLCANSTKWCMNIGYSFKYLQSGDSYVYHCRELHSCE